jgi:hypothetical protein
MKAKEFLDNKQNVHFKKFGVYADVNSKIAEWMEEYAYYANDINVPTIDVPNANIKKL